MNIKTEDHNTELKRIIERGIAAQAMLRDLKLRVLETNPEERGSMTTLGLEEIYSKIQELK